MMRRLLPWGIIGFLVMLLGALVLAGSPSAAQDIDFDIPGGHFYKQTNGQGGAGDEGYAISNTAGVPFWDVFRGLGGPPHAGYPTSRRFFWQGFWTQAMQKLVFQWRPELGQVYFINVFDELSLAGYDPWLYVFRQTPPPFDTLPDTGLPWDQVVARHLAFLDSDPAIKARYFAEPDWLDRFGLPMSYGDFGDVFVVRAQRAVLQRWKVDVPWANAGEVVIANGGDIAKEVDLFPLDAVATELPPGVMPTATSMPTATPTPGSPTPTPTPTPKPVPAPDPATVPVAGTYTVTYGTDTVATVFGSALSTTKGVFLNIGIPQSDLIGRTLSVNVNGVETNQGTQSATAYLYISYMGALKGGQNMYPYNVNPTDCPSAPPNGQVDACLITVGNSLKWKMQYGQYFVIFRYTDAWGYSAAYQSVTYTISLE